MKPSDAIKRRNENRRERDRYFAAQDEWAKRRAEVKRAFSAMVKAGKKDQALVERDAKAKDLRTKIGNANKIAKKVSLAPLKFTGRA